MNPAGFKHNEQSVRVAQCLEKNGQGLNLTWEVLDGMKNHSMHSMPHTLEGKIVRLADKIAYINHDIDDSVRAKVLREEDLPKEFTEVLGTTYRERINTMVLDIVKHSENLKKMIDKPGDVPVAVCDYIAGMTDHFAIEKYTEIFIPKFFMQK